ncbi:MAG: neutral/alkaline non-lysosomal ceramidase N-terminal domain-containing protein [Kiritimatiellae bacterium]|nr:neutral/alkaline non-lysosomal ceramidase N-terminal domain-containing protein [Kiritimatiellia bacterium]
MKKAIMLALALMTGAVSAEFKAGFARVDATPPLGIPIVGYFHKRIADGVLDPLYVDCVAVSDSTNSALIYCVDSLGLRNAFIAKAIPAITAATGVPGERIYVHATHTHTGPASWTRGSFSKEENLLVTRHANALIDKMAGAGKKALADRTPAKIGVAKTVCRNVSFIRRYRMKDGSVRTNPGVTNPNVKEPLGTPDETLQLVRFRRTGAPDIAIVNFGTHPDSIKGTKISADWPGVVRNTFEAAVGDGVKCLFLNGAQGDVNNAQRFPPPGRAALNTEQKTTRPKARAIHMGRAVAGAALSVWDVCEEIPAGPVRGIVARHPMPANLPTADEIKWVELFDAGRRKEIPLGRMEIMTLTSPGSRVRRMKKGRDHFNILVSSLAIGDSLAFAGLPGEPFVDIGRAVKARSPFRTTIVTCLTNGSEGYIPSTKAHADGGYEALSSRFAAPTGDELVDAQVEQLKALKGDAKSAARK